MLQYNALVPLLLLALVAVDVLALTRLLRGKETLFDLPRWCWIAGVAMLIGYMILRNYLMIAHGYDPVGDLGVFWR